MPQLQTAVTNFYQGTLIVLLTSSHFLYVKLSKKITPSEVELLKLLKKEVTQGQSPSPTHVLAAKSAEVMTEKSSANELKKGVHHK